MDAEELLKRYTAGERNFTWVDLQKAQLNNLDLSGINLTNANLDAVCLVGTNLSRAKLNGATF